MTAVEAPAELATRLLQGEPAVIPTDTVVGLAAKPEHAQQLWQLKRRPADKPLILMAASAKPLLDAVEEHCHHDAWSLMDRHWPGALTLVLPAKGPLVELLNPGGNTLGLRIPACDLTLELLRFSGPLATSSANPAGQSPAGSAAQAAVFFPDVAQLSQPWPSRSGLASSVVQWCSPGTWQVLRQGAVMLKDVH